jgi:hypothetical protein
MVETIAPVVHGGKNRSYWTAVLLHTLGTTLSAAAFGAVLGFVGSLLGAPWGTAGLVALAVVAAVYAARELFNLPIPLPDLDRQVPEWWRTFYSKNVAAFLYGLGLGVGWLTYLSFGTYVAVMTGAFISGDPATGALICGAFGLARGIGASLSLVTTDQLAVWGQSTWPRQTNAMALILVGAVPLMLL